MPKHSFTLLSLFVALLHLSCATTAQAYWPTYVESIVSRRIAESSQRFYFAHSQKLPTQWSDFDSMFEGGMDGWMPFAVPTKRYALLTPPIPITTPVQGEVFSINRRDIYDSYMNNGLKGPGRYAIYKTTDDQFKTVWLSPKEVTNLFLINHRPLPEQDHEPEREWVTRARRTYYFNILIYTCIAAAILWYIRHRLRAKSSLSNVPVKP